MKKPPATTPRGRVFILGRHLNNRARMLRARRRWVKGRDRPGTRTLEAFSSEGAGLGSPPMSSAVPAKHPLPDTFRA